MQNRDKLAIMMKSTILLFQECLTSIGVTTLEDFENQMEQMSEDQQIEFIARKAEENPFTLLKKSVETLEKSYTEFENDPMLMAEAQAMFEKMLTDIGLQELITDTTEESNEDDDDTTKH